MANKVDQDQTAPVWSGSTLFANTCLSENLRSLRYLPLENFKNTAIVNGVTFDSQDEVKDLSTCNDQKQSYVRRNS